MYAEIDENVIPAHIGPQVVGRMSRGGSARGSFEGFGCEFLRKWVPPWIPFFHQIEPFRRGASSENQ